MRYLLKVQNGVDQAKFLSQYIDYQLVNSYKYAHEIMKTQFFDLQLPGTISVVRKLKLMRIDREH